MKIYHMWELKTVLHIDIYCKADEKTLCIIRDYQTAVNSFIVFEVNLRIQNILVLVWSLNYFCMGLRTLHSSNFQLCSTLNHSKQKKAYVSCYIVESGC